MALASARTGAEPMMDMNTTPLIDVLLVLLVMLIITIPVATHSTVVDLPGITRPDVRPDPVRNRIVLTRSDAILWNGRAVSGAQLRGLLAETLTYATEPELQFQPDPDAGYDLSARVLQTIKASGASKFGFTGNEQYADFGKAAQPR